METDGIHAKITIAHKQARLYAEAGIPVFPCRINGKEPITTRGFYDASVDLDQIDRWATEHPDCNWGFEPERADWCVIDIDAKGGGWDHWVNLPGDKPRTFTVSTPHNGYHLYYKGSLPGSSSKIAPSIDTRGRSSYVLLPGSVIDGKAYTVLEDWQIAPLPQWISDAFGHHRERVRAAAPDHVTFDTSEALAWLREKIVKDIEENREPAEGAGSDHRAYQFINALIDGPRYGCSFNPETLTELLHDEWAPHFDIEWIEQKIENALRYRQEAPGCAPGGSDERKYGDPTSWPTEPAPSDVTVTAPLPLFRPWPAIKNAHFDPPQWVWQDRLLAFEPNLYTGDAGVGKTTLAENIAVAVSCGVPLLSAATRRMPVAILVAEDTYGPVRDNIQAIAQALGVADHSGLANIHTLSVKSDKVAGGHSLARITDDGQIHRTRFLAEGVWPFLNSFAGRELLWVVDPLSEFVLFNNLSGLACRALATTFLAEHCAFNNGRITVLVNDHPSKASMASGDHYPGSVQLKAAFSFMATLIGKEWSGTLHRQRKLTFEVKKGRYAAEESITFYRTSQSPAFAIEGLPGHRPSDIARRVYHHIIARLDMGQWTGRTNRHTYGPGLVGQTLGLSQIEVKQAMNYCRSQGWLTETQSTGTGGKDRVPAHWERGSIIPMMKAEEPEAGEY